MEDRRTTLDKVKADPGSYKRGGSLVLVTSQRDVAELDWVCCQHGIVATLVVNFEEAVSFVYRRTYSMSTVN
jgi:hypothetical protein